METTLVQLRSRWHLAFSVVCSAIVVLLLLLYREVVTDALALVTSAEPVLVAAAVMATLLGYLASSQVFRIGLARSAIRIGILPLWAMTLTAIAISQILPGGGVGSYAFFVSVLKRRGASTSQAAVLAGLEAMSYLAVMVVWASFSVLYIALYALADPEGSARLWSLCVAGIVAMSLLAVLGYLTTRDEAALTRTGLAVSRLMLRWLRRPSADEHISRLVHGFVRERDLLIAEPGRLACIVAVQIAAQMAHSLAIWLVLLSLGVHIGLAAALATFGTTLILSSINVLPGGGGTVEAVLVAVLVQFDVGTAAIPAAVLFRLMNYWMLLPVAAAASSWLLRDRDE